MGNFRYCIKEIKDLERLQQQLFQQWRKRYREKETQEGILEEYLGELTKYKGIAEKGDLEALYSCFELNALIELEEHCNIEPTGTAFLYLKEAAERGYTKAVKVYIVMMLKGFDIKVIIQKINPLIKNSPVRIQFIDIKTPETNKDWAENGDRYKDLDIQERNINFGLGVKAAERAVNWFTSEAKREIEVQKIIGWVKEARESLEKSEKERKAKEEEIKKTEKAVKRFFRIISLILMLALFLYYYHFGFDVSQCLSLWN